ncbi:hypothetical protein V494_08107, partial [Pseudogymnoascus sp. VKM F-4513 (FW-928)]
MSLPLPPDPYKALGVAKDAAISEVKSAYRKLVLKCHPDKVQDPTLKAQKQDEFQKVQQAYELLTDDNKRTEYDEKMRMFAFRDTLRAQQVPKSSPQAARSSPAAHSPPVFDYEVRTAEPRSARFKTSRAPSPIRTYAPPRPSSYEDDTPLPRMYDTGSRSARKTASYDDRKVPSKDEDKRRRGEERERDRHDKEVNKKNLSASKKTRDKERRKGAEEKTSRRTQPFIVDDYDSEDGFPPARSERRSSKKKSDDTIRVTSNGRTNEFIITERHRKLQQTNDSAAEYILKAKAKAKGKSPEPEFRPTPVRRSETYHTPPYATRYPAPPPQSYVEPDSDDDVRRSSARTRSRRPSDALPPRVPPGNEPFIITADPSSRKPSLQSHSSAPPIVSEPRKPQRAQTLQSDYARRSSASAVPPPPLPRAKTFSVNEKQSPRPSRLQAEYQYPSSSDSSDSDSDGPVRFVSPSRSSRNSPPTQSGTQKRYVIEKSRAVPVSRSHRKALRDDSFVSSRDRSESPLGTPARAPERP